MRWALKPTLTMPERSSLDGVGVGGVQHGHGHLVAGAEGLLVAILRNRLRMFMVTSPKVDLDRAGL